MPRRCDSGSTVKHVRVSKRLMRRGNRPGKATQGVTALAALEHETGLGNWKPPKEGVPALAAWSRVGPGAQSLFLLAYLGLEQGSQCVSHKRASASRQQRARPAKTCQKQRMPPERAAPQTQAVELTRTCVPSLGTRVKALVSAPSIPLGDAPFPSSPWVSVGELWRNSGKASTPATRPWPS